MRFDVDQVSDLIVEVAEAEALPRFQALQSHEIMEKAAGDLVTVADLAVEKHLTGRLKDILPGSQVVGEEAAEADPGIFDLFRQGKDPVWIIDPIDGTGNYARGRPVFAVMVALSQGEDILGGWIYDPINKVMAVAEKGSGAYLAGQSCRVAPPQPLADMKGTLHASTYAAKDMGACVQQNRHKVQALKSLSCAGHEYLRLLRGDMHFSLFSRCKPWDHAPGSLLHREAGGHAIMLRHDRPYQPTDYAEVGLMMAPDAQSWAELKDAMLGDLDLNSLLAVV
ncbi:inositol monophosphatase family protein [Rhodovibrionaceae bacterium A322]